MSVANDMGSPGCSLSTAARPISFGVAQGTKPCRADSARRSSHRVESKSKGQLLMGEAGSISSDTELFGHEAEPGSDRSDYVNASYISYFDGPLYIATQGPLPETVGDFWRMVWEERAQVVVMLTKEYENGRPKCHRYWPSQIGHTAMYGELCVEWQVEAHHPDDASIIARRFRLSQPTATAATVCVTHLQYVGWPDHGVPENPLGVLRLIHLARRAQAEAEQKSERGPAERIPMVVHCSAGCGRTGAFCAIDTVAEMASVDANGDTPMSDLCNPPAPAAMATSPNRHSVFTGMVPQALRSGGPSATPGTGGEPATQQGWGPGNAESSDDGRFRRSLTQWDEKPPADLHSDLVFMVVSRFRELRITMVQTLRQFVFCHEALAWMALNAGPRPIDQVIDRRLVAEWNRMNYPNLSEADCVDISLLLRGRQEMVQAMLRSEIGGTTKGGAADAVPAKSSMAGLPGGRASIDIVGGGGMPLGDDSPIASRPPAVKRSNTVGPARRGFLASMFQLVTPASGSAMDTGRTAHAPIAEEEPMAVDAADAVHMSLSMSPAPPQESPPPPPPPLPPPLATSTIHEPTGDDYFGLASARIGLQASRANPDLPVAPGGGWRWNGGGYMAAAASPRHSFYYPMAGMSDDTPPTSPAYASSTALASPSAQ
ncbi:hypothetical protein H4R21_004225 [Coemansia helicoidea]|uniref:Uncharacterized protein n=1 Tax=Coemansia helicoidea TaxID=1286919 RepID=A0ACC1KZ24_9FUNG|nr:hypothetical protein H4R21_004225 [Coemansia helicoidea]